MDFTILSSKYIINRVFYYLDEDGNYGRKNYPEHPGRNSV